MVVALYVHRGEGERPPFKSPQTPLHLIFLAIGQHRLRQGQRLYRLIRPIDAPPQPAYRCRQRGFVHTDLDSGMTLVVAPRWLPPVGPHWTRRGMLGQAKPYKVLHLMVLPNR